MIFLTVCSEESGRESLQSTPPNMDEDHESTEAQPLNLSLATPNKPAKEDPYDHDFGERVKAGKNIQFLPWDYYIHNHKYTNFKGDFS